MINGLNEGIGLLKKAGNPVGLNQVSAKHIAKTNGFPLFSGDTFIKNAATQKTKGIQKASASALPEIQFGQNLLPDNMNLAYMVYLLGNDKKGNNGGVARQVEGIKIAPEFASPEEQKPYTYGDLFDGMMDMATAYQRAGLESGSKIAMAETNTMDFLTGYFGGLALQATMIPLNLLALADESTKIDVLAHMLSTPLIRKHSYNEQQGADAFIFGKDELFNKMHKLNDALRIKNKKGKYKIPGLSDVIERHVSGVGANTVFEKMRDKALKGLASKKLEDELFPDKESLNAIREVIATSVKPEDKAFEKFKPENKDDVLAGLSPEAKTEYEAKRAAAIEKGKKDLSTMLKHLPSRMKVITPANRMKLTKRSLIRESFHPSQIVPGAEPSKVADILYTSGTTQMPKGVLLTHRNLVFMTNSIVDATKEIIKPGDKILLGLPLFHIFGRAILMAAFARQLEMAQNLQDKDEVNKNKIDMVMLPSLTTAIKQLDKVFKTIEDEKITILPAVPTFLNAMMEYVNKHPEAAEQLKSLDTIVSGGEALSKSTFDKLMAINPNLKIIEGYGSTEGGINLLNTSGNYGYVGTPMPNVETKIVKEDPEADRGELWVKSPGVAKRYAFGTIADEKTPIVDAEGWYHTGDIVSKDDKKMFKIVGRDSFFIKRKGERRPPEAFEAVIKQCLPTVTDAMVIPYHEGEGTEDERALAVVTTTDSNLTETTLKSQLKALPRTEVPGWAVPDHVIVLNQPTMPPRFDNGFKRDAGYKLIKQFVETLKANNAIELNKADGSFSTVITDNTNFNTVLDEYNKAPAN